MALILLIILGVAVYIMTPDERKRAVRGALALAGEVITISRRHYQERDAFREALSKRTPWTLVTPGLCVLNSLLFLAMVPAAGPVGSHDTLVAWGGNVGPQTTNGEWWRLVTNVFLHRSLMHLAFNMIGLVQIGLLLERLVGGLVFGGVYVAAGTLASLACLSSYPLDLSVGGTAAVFGLYGLFFAVLARNWLRPSAMSVPLSTLKWLAPGTGLFVLYNLVTGGLGGSPMIGLFVGAAGAFVLGGTIGGPRPTARRVATAAAATAVLAVALAVPLRGVADVRPRIENMLASEDRTASTYRKAVEDFRGGRLTAGDLIQLIDETIVPELEAYQTELRTFDGVPRQHESLVSDAAEYLRLREESWRLRAEGLTRVDMRTLGEADRQERVALDAFEALKANATAQASSS